MRGDERGCVVCKGRRILADELELTSRRYERKSTVVTTNTAFADWHEVLPSAACVVSLIDRLLHHAEVIALEGESYRLKEAKERAARQQRQRSGKKR